MNVKKKSKNLRETVSKLRALTSLNQVEYDDLLRVFAPLIETKGGDKNNFPKLALKLVYL